MTTLSQNEINLYKSCFESLDKLYDKYWTYDQQIKNNINWESLDIDDLNNLLEIVGPSITRFKIVKEIQRREDLHDNV